MKKLSEMTIPELFQSQVKKLGDKGCVAYKKDGGPYVDISWNEMDQMIRSLALFLISIGVKKKDRVAIFSPNRYEWWVADQAILSIGAVDVPIYATNSGEEAQYVLKHSESTVCLVATEDHLNRVLKVKRGIPKLKTIVIFDEIAKKPAGVQTFSDVLKKGAQYKNKAMFDKRLKEVKQSDMATIIYTSGTTGDPKGVMLSHKNFIVNVDQTSERAKDVLGENTDTLLSFLPLSHSLERTCGYYIPVKIGAKVAFAEDFSKIQGNLAEVRPTIIITVPRLLEKVHAGIQAKLADAPAIKKKLFNWAMGVAKQNLPYVCSGIKPTGFVGKKVDLANKLIFSKLKVALGFDRLNFVSSGGGPLSVSDCEFFMGMGLMIVEGYGLTETTPVLSTNKPGMLKPGSVGPALINTTIRISDDGEIQAKGPQIMMGYYKNPKATKESFTKDGFYKTGDIGVIDEKGRISITGRIKDIIVTSGGKNISPQNIENSLKESKYIEQAAVIGDNRKYLSCLVIPSFEEVKKWAQGQGITVSNNNDLVNNDKVNALIGKEIEKYMKQYSRAEQIRKFRLLNAEWTQESGELTPTLKVKRRIVNEKYAAEIESMYPPDND